MPFSKPLPEWNNPGSEPLQSKKDAGWGVEEHPPSDWFNWQWHAVYQALQELQQQAIHNDQKGATNGVAELVNGKIPVGQMGPLGNNLSIKTGTISNGATIPKTPGYTNYKYLVSVNNVVSDTGNAYSSSSDGTGFDIVCSVDQSTRIVTIKSRASSAHTGWIEYAGGTANYTEIAW